MPARVVICGLLSLWLVFEFVLLVVIFVVRCVVCCVVCCLLVCLVMCVCGFVVMFMGVLGLWLGCSPNVSLPVEPLRQPWCLAFRLRTTCEAPRGFRGQPGEGTSAPRNRRQR